MENTALLAFSEGCIMSTLRKRTETKPLCQGAMSCPQLSPLLTSSNRSQLLLYLPVILTTQLETDWEAGAGTALGITLPKSSVTLFILKHGKRK